MSQTREFKKFIDPRLKFVEGKDINRLDLIFEVFNLWDDISIDRNKVINDVTNDLQLLDTKGHLDTLGSFPLETLHGDLTNFLLKSIKIYKKRLVRDLMSKGT